ncbi:MAG: hypothetical protein JWM10_2736, partial [Myxococcaceae bacterium]|nr:hypothetical protein [Myxococcaceae bacterium]
MKHRQLGLLGVVVGLALACTDGSSVVGGAPDAAASDLGVDAPDVVDAVDAPDAPDVPFRCAASADCVGHAEGAACDAATGRCVRCLATADTCPAGQYCVA